MKAVVFKVLSLDEKISKATDHYYDDIIIDLNVVSAQVVKDHLLKFGLITKPSENLNFAKVLGLQTYEKKGVVYWRRTELKKEINPSNLNSMTKRQVFSLCGNMVGHYPVAGWSRVVCSFVKRSYESNAWDSFSGSVAIQRMRKVLSRLDVDDSVKEIWSASSGKLNVWCDASQIAYGVALERKNQIIEDGDCLRKADDGTHINLAELNAVIKGVNLAMKWGAGDIIIFTDSAAVYSWLSSLLKKDKRIRVSGLSETLVKRRLLIFSETLEAYKVEWSVSLVSTTKNKADGLTRVPKHWLTIPSSSSNCAIAFHEKFPNDCGLAEQSHTLHHCGAETTLHFARKLDPSYSKSDAEFVVKNCRECQSIDPSAVRINGGELSVEED